MSWLTEFCRWLRWRPGLFPLVFSGTFGHQREAEMPVVAKAGVRIVIDDDVVITVVEWKRGSVRIGIEAPHRW